MYAKYNQFIDSVICGLSEKYIEAVEKREDDYSKAIELADREDFDGAISILRVMGDYKEAEARSLEYEEKKQRKIDASLREQKRKKKRIILTLVSLFCLVILFVLFIVFALPKIKYNKAQNLFNNGKYVEAKRIYVSLSDYENSSEMAQECDYLYAGALLASGNYGEAITIYNGIESYKDSEILMNQCENIQMLKFCSIGDVVTFGNFDIDKNPDNGVEDIEWVVIDKKDNAVMLLSRWCIESREYHYTRYGDISWQNCSLRKWLNESFYLDSFGEIEKGYILETHLDNSSEEYKEQLADVYHVGWDISESDEDRDTNDFIFILSLNEREKYISKSMYATNTYYNASGNESSTTTWCRLPFIYVNSGRHVRCSGGMEISHNSLWPDQKAGVRPAMWISLE